MELKEFISKTFEELIDGVLEAQAYASAKGAAVAKSRTIHGPIKGISDCQKNAEGIINFEVILSEIIGKDEKAGIGVFLKGVTIGYEAKKGGENASSTKIGFSIPFEFPPSPQTKKLE